MRASRCTAVAGTACATSAAATAAAATAAAKATACLALSHSITLECRLVAHCEEHVAAAATVTSTTASTYTHSSDHAVTVANCYAQQQQQLVAQL
jgi:hypothetical protein